MELGSMNCPAASSATFTATRNIHGERSCEVTHSETACGICSDVSRYENSIAFVTM